MGRQIFLVSIFILSFFMGSAANACGLSAGGSCGGDGGSAYMAYQVGFEADTLMLDGGREMMELLERDQEFRRKTGYKGDHKVAPHIIREQEEYDILGSVDDEELSPAEVENILSRMAELDQSGISVEPRNTIKYRGRFHRSSHPQHTEDRRNRTTPNTGVSAG